MLNAEGIELHLGDCREVMPALDADSVDSIVCDPPYGLGFLGKDWDHGVPGVQFWREALRAAKPGAHLLAFGGTRTFHRLAVAIEDAGWEIRDTVMWVHGQGYPKSSNVSKQLEKVAATSEAERWQGWGTSLKPSFEPVIWAMKPLRNLVESKIRPAWEPIIVARKPFDGRVAQNVLRWGCGGINVDGCRVDASDGRPLIESKAKEFLHSFGSGSNWSRCAGETTLGRWPANVVHDGSDEVMELFPVTMQASWRKPQPDRAYPDAIFSQAHRARERDERGHNDTGSTARFFYCAKASTGDRDEGLEFGSRSHEGDEEHEARRRNHHPTVKPIALMRWLVRLVTPAGGVVLDPFMGSGSTGKAAVLEGFRFIGIEMDADYLDIARRRIGAAGLQMRLVGE